MRTIFVQRLALKFIMHCIDSKAYESQPTCIIRYQYKRRLSAFQASKQASKQTDNLSITFYEARYKPKMGLDVSKRSVECNWNRFCIILNSVLSTEFAGVALLSGACHLICDFHRSEEIGSQPFRQTAFFLGCHEVIAVRHVPVGCRVALINWIPEDRHPSLV